MTRKGDHRHLLKCRIIQPLLKEFKELANKLMRGDNVTFTERDLVHGTFLHGKEMPKGLLIFYTIMFKHIWMSYCAHYKANEHFSCQGVWKRTTRRIRKIIRTLDVSFDQARSRIQRLSNPELVEAAIGHELRRTNLKTDPIGSFNNSYEFEPAVDWKTYYDIEATLPL